MSRLFARIFQELEAHRLQIQLPRHLRRAPDIPTIELSPQCLIGEVTTARPEAGLHPSVVELVPVEVLRVKALRRP